MADGDVAALQGSLQLVLVVPGDAQCVQAGVKANPITHLASAARGFMHGGLDMTDVMWVLVWSVGLVAVFAPLTMRLYNKER